MKKPIIFAGVLLLFVAGFVAFFANRSMSAKKSLIMRNIEALAEKELGQEGTPGTCGMGVRFANGDWFAYCNICKEDALALYEAYNYGDSRILSVNWCCESCSSAWYC
ncbi:MAG TPA: hypothetical protein DEQ30_13385 [Porphyromonadaceae bacterium]|nr:hypothetical protein [Porphyromonadaceae bacterium]